MSNTKKYPKNYRFTKKKKIQAAKEICKLYAEGIYTLASCCEAKGVKYDSFRKWKQEGTRGYVSEVSKIFKEATDIGNQTFMRMVKENARSGLLDLVREREVEDVQTDVKMNDDGTTKPVSIRKTKKILQPNTTAVIFALKNSDKSNFEDRVVNEGSMDLHHYKYEDLSDDELDKKIKESEKMLKKKK